MYVKPQNEENILQKKNSNEKLEAKTLNETLYFHFSSHLFLV